MSCPFCFLHKFDSQPVILPLCVDFYCSIFNGLPETFEVARYHSLYGLRDKLPSCLGITALTEDGIVMGIKHKTLPYAAVQFHPESILTNPVHGMSILKNALSFLSYGSEVNGN